LNEKNKFFKCPVYDKEKAHSITRAETINNIIPELSIVIAKTY
jgi:hypothetical protein